MPTLKDTLNGPVGCNALAAGLGAAVAGAGLTTPPHMRAGAAYTFANAAVAALQANATIGGALGAGATAAVGGPAVVATAVAAAPVVLAAGAAALTSYGFFKLCQAVGEELAAREKGREP